MPQDPSLERPLIDALAGHPVRELFELLLVVDRDPKNLPPLGELGRQLPGVAKAEPPVRPEAVL